MPDPEAPVEGNPEAATAPPTTPEPASGEQGQEPEYFDEKFDPASLPEELRVGYKQMRDAFSKKTQTLAEERRALQEQFEASQQGPQEEEEYDDNDEYEDPYEQRLAAIEQALNAQHQTAQQHAQEEAEYNYIVDGLKGLQEKTGREFDPEELNALGLLSERLRDPQGKPDVDQAYELIYATVLPKERERWKQQKDSPQAPSGSTPTEVPDLTTEQGRVAHMKSRLAAMEVDDFK